MFTQRHFEAIAKVIAKELEWFQNHSERRAITIVARSLADEFARDNERFDRQKFYAACGLNVEGNFPISERSQKK